MEVELKAPAPKDVERTLARLGAKKLSEEHEKDVYYDRSGELLSEGKTLRLRYSGHTKKLTYKGPQTRRDVKALEEIEAGVDGDVEGILSRLGMREDLVKEKLRTTFELGGVKVNVDDVVGLGRFVELEAIADDVDRAKALLLAAFDRLGIPRSQAITKSYPEMIRELNSKRR
jgi:adenylate cyclase class 2